MSFILFRDIPCLLQDLQEKRFPLRQASVPRRGGMSCPELRFDGYWNHICDRQLSWRAGPRAVQRAVC